jgi:hypothetical protein
VTRSLWDPTYTDPTWINDQIDLIPRMKNWVASAYPGTKVSLSEYDLSVPNGTANKATLDVLIEADALGIFAREGLDLATRWGAPAATDQLANAWRIYRNYDGQGGKFGDTFVQSTSANQSQLAAYSAQRSTDGALTTVVVNKSATDLTSSLSLSGFTPGGAAKVYRWTGSGIAAAPDQPVTASGFTATYPARSITMVVVPQGGIASPPPTADPPTADPPTTIDPPGPIIPPDTSISKKPVKKTTKTRAAFEFSANQPGVQFSCKLDRKPAAACTSPMRYAKLSPGKHSFTVFAESGTAQDATPAKFTWRIRRR